MRHQQLTFSLKISRMIGTVQQEKVTDPWQ